MRPEEKENLINSIQHAFHVHTLNDLPNDDRYAYEEARKNLNGYQKDVSNETLADAKITELRNQNEAFEQSYQTEEQRFDYFKGHLSEKPDWAERYRKINEISDRLPGRQEEERALLEKEAEAKRLYDAECAKPFEVSIDDKDYVSINRMAENLQNEEKKIEEERKNHRRNGLILDADQKEIERIHSASASKEALDAAWEKCRYSYDTIDHSEDDDLVEREEDELDEYLSGQTPEIREYVAAKRKLDTDTRNHEEEAKNIDDSANTLERNKRTYGKLVQEAKDRAYPELKSNYDKAKKEHQEAMDKLSADTSELTNLRNSASDSVKYLFIDRKNNNKRSIALLETFKKAEKQLLTAPEIHVDAIRNSVSSVKAAYQSYYNAHNAIGRFFKFLKWTSAHHDYQDYLDVRKSFKDIVRDRVSDRDLDDYVKNNKAVIDAVPAPEEEPNPQHRQQIEVDDREEINNKEEQKDLIQENAPEKNNEIQNEAHQ